MLDQYNGGCLALERLRACAAQSHSSIIDDDTIVATRKLADFEWDIVRKAGYPIFSFANSSQSEVTFKYSVSGTERPVRTELSNISGERLSGGL
jgi:hypothetical protein